MTQHEKESLKSAFLENLKTFAKTLKQHVSTPDNYWTIKGFIDVFKNIHTISNDTKIVSKVLEIQLFSKFLEFAEAFDFHLVFAEKQNWYPDLSFVSKSNPALKFALDLKTTYRLEKNPEYCNGFTLGSHGIYFIDRTSSKNIQFPYRDYLAHYCLGVIYNRTAIERSLEAKTFQLQDLPNIPSVIHDLTFFACEKWMIASDKSGSGNTANIGSILNIQDILDGNGIFKNLGENWFDDYWMNFGKINVQDESGRVKRITNLQDFLKYRGTDEKLAHPKTSRKGRKNGV